MKSEKTKSIKDLWRQWGKQKDEQTANDLINYYMYLVHYHVERIASYIPNSFDKNDLHSLGLLGLYDALHKFDISRKLKFDTYATIRIRGAMIDGLRKEDWLPRTIRDQAKLIEQTSQMLENKLERTPTAKDIASHLNMNENQVTTVITDTLFANVLSMDATTGYTDSGDEIALSSTIVDDKVTGPDIHMGQMMIKEELMEGLKQLNENEQLVISLFYFDELTLTEIGQVLELTTSRVSQIHKKAIFKLRNALKQLNSEYVG